MHARVTFLLVVAIIWSVQVAAQPGLGLDLPVAAVRGVDGLVASAAAAGVAVGRLDAVQHIGKYQSLPLNCMRVAALALIASHVTDGAGYSKDRTAYSSPVFQGSQVRLEVKVHASARLCCDEDLPFSFGCVGARMSQRAKLVEPAADAVIVENEYFVTFAAETSPAVINDAAR